MSELSDQYRQMAAQARSDAESAQLPNVRQLRLQSAERFDQIAQQIENGAKAKARDEAANLSDTVTLDTRAR